jgi:hypothetical protein
MGGIVCAIARRRDGRERPDGPSSDASDEDFTNPRAGSARENPENAAKISFSPPWFCPKRVFEIQSAV